MNFKIAAQLDDNGTYITTTLIQESPEEPGVWLYPPNTVDLLPDPSIDLEEYNAIYDSTTNTYNYISKLSPTEKLQKLKIDKIKELLEIVDNMINTYTYDYSETEKLSWAKQEKEALELLQDPNAEVPFLRKLASTRGIDLYVLRDRILFNIDNYVYLSSLIIGVQQKYIDLINSYTIDNIDELQALRFTFPV
jgi:hypothetical protein